jgi:hypothetical protein
MHKFYTSSGHKAYKMQFPEIEKRWDDLEWTVETAIHMRRAGYYVPEKIWRHMGLEEEEYAEPDYGDVNDHDDSAAYMANERDLKEPKYAWDPKANGKPKDWNEQETWCKAAYKEAAKKWKDKEIRTPSVSEFLDAFLETRTDEKGTPVRRLLSNPRKKDGGWVRYDYVPPKPYHEMYPDAYNKDKKLKEGRWCQAVHGSNIAALYSILATGTIQESTTTEDGDRFFPTAPGAYCHGFDPESQKKVKDLRHKADNYLTYWSPLDDGIYYAVKIDLDVDRDQGKISRGDQWVQPGDSTRIT